MEYIFSKCRRPPGFPEGTLLDDEDRAAFEGVHWWKNGTGYVAREVGIQIGGAIKRKVLLLHREIAARMVGRELASSKIEQVDHINACKLDNRRCNLRIVSPGMNSQNVHTYKNNKVGIRGVQWSFTGRAWLASMQVENHRFYLGCYDDIDDAISIAEEARERWMPGFVPERETYEECRRKRLNKEAVLAEYQQYFDASPNRRVSRNRRSHPNDKISGACGVSWNRNEKKWMAYVHIEGHVFFLGYYNNVEDATSIVEEARERWGGGRVSERNAYSGYHYITP
jgi:hypothetical protein